MKVKYKPEEWWCYGCIELRTPKQPCRLSNGKIFFDGKTYHPTDCNVVQKNWKTKEELKNEE